MKIKNTLYTIILLVVFGQTNAQVSVSGCVAGDVGINATLYANSTFTNGTPIAPIGNVDWFRNSTGRNIIDQTNPSVIQNLLQNNLNPLYERRQNCGLGSHVDEVIVNGVRRRYKRLVDAVWARDHFGGTGGIDQTSFNTASKNGEDPGIWDVGAANVLGKNDLVDVAGHMFRNVDLDAGINDLWFTGLINRAEPGGDAYMDFEFFIQPVALNTSTNKLNSGGPNLGHTAFTFDAAGNITGMGDMIFNLALTSGGTAPQLEVRVWVSRNDYTTKTPSSFNWGPEFDGAFMGAPFGYASVIPKVANTMCGFVNGENQFPVAPPWGTRNTKSNIYQTSYTTPYSVSEVALNLTSIGLDTYLINNALDSCTFPWRTFIVKTRASNSFTAQLKDFAGPYEWARPSTGILTANGTISCYNPIVTLNASPLRNDVTYSWSTTNGNIVGSTTGPSITVNKAGSYQLVMILPSGCPVISAPIIVTTDPAQPQITAATTTSTVSCNGSNGTVSLSIAGGVPPYTISWTRDGAPFGTSTQTLTGLAPGTYVASINDVNGCTRTSTSAIVDAATPISITSGITHVLCNGRATGSVSITPQSGNQPFTYQWSNGQTTQNLQNVAAGNYTLTVTDATNCPTTYNYTINQPTAIAPTAVKADDTDPNPVVGNGSINLTISGGTAPYTYAWTGPSGFTSTAQNVTNLRAGTYTVSVRDANNCTTTLTRTVYEPEICNDGIDNDGDGQSDCDDTDCTPAIPGVVTGESAPCINQNIIYIVPAVAGLTYQWAVPSNGTIISGQGTNSITIRWNTTTPGVLCVRATNGACLSEQRCYTVNPKNVPPAPTAIIRS